MLLKKAGIVGLSFRDNIVRVSQCRSESSAVMYTVGKAVIPQEVIVDQSVSDPDVLAQAIQTACNEATPYAIRRDAKVVFTIPESKTFIRIVSLPHMREDEVSKALRWEIEDYIPLSVEDVYYDWQRMPNIKDQESITVVVVAAARSVVDSYVNAIEMAHLRVVGVEADSIADARALQTPEWEQKNVMILSSGHLQSRIAIITNGIPIFTVTIPVGRAHFISNIERAMDVSTQEAERLIISDGIGSYVTRDPLFFALKPLLITLADEVKKSADFCRQTLPHCSTMSSVVFCGSGVKIKGLRAFLVKEIGMPIMIANPWQNVQLPKKTIPLMSYTDSLEAVTSIGSAIKQFSYADFN